MAIAVTNSDPCPNVFLHAILKSVLCTHRLRKKVLDVLFYFFLEKRRLSDEMNAKSLPQRRLLNRGARVDDITIVLSGEFSHFFSLCNDE